MQAQVRLEGKMVLMTWRMTHYSM